jgi:hypothetical protein
MLLISNLFLLLVNAVTLRREFTTLFNRVAVFIWLYSGIIGYDSLYVTYLDNGIGVYNGLFHSTAITHSFDLFTYIIASIILLLTAFYARRIVQPLIPYNRFENNPRCNSETKNGLLLASNYGPGCIKPYINAANNSQRRYCSGTNKAAAHNLLNTHNLHPWYVTGFIDGEGCFTPRIYGPLRGGGPRARPLGRAEGGGINY